MAFPFRRVLCPIDVDYEAGAAVELGRRIATQNDGTVYVLHVVPMVVPATGLPVHPDLSKDQEEAAREKMEAIARRHLGGVRHELMTRVGDPAACILMAEKEIPADLIVMATHLRTGLSRLLLGSVTQMVLRESTCPVLTTRTVEPNKHLVGHWMTTEPVSASPDDKLSEVQTKMRAGGFRSVPVVEGSKLVGIVSDRDIRQHVGYLEHTEARIAMTTEVLTVTPRTSIWDTARLLRERKIGAMPVLDEGRLVGIISTSDILGAFTQLQ